jgi:GH18 family chitinase
VTFDLKPGYTENMGHKQDLFGGKTDACQG